MARAISGADATIRDITSVCDLCGDTCSGQNEICMGVTCHRCDTKLYHQACLEKFLKKHGLAANRMRGFPCPFGRGKGTSVECKGKVEKCHPIVPKNEEKKKARIMAPAMLEAMARQPKQAANTNAGKAAAAAKGPASKPPVPKLPAARKVAPPRTHNWPTSTPRAQHSVPGTPAGVWGLKGAAPVLANASLPPPEEADPSAAAAGAQGPRPAELPVGLVLEEAFSKAQRKNLARKLKRAAAAGGDTVSEASSDHQDNVSAALGLTTPSALSSTNGSTPRAVSAGAGGHALVGFDGASMAHMQGGDDDLLAQQGHRFINDPAEYARLLGLYCADDSDEEEEEVQEAGGYEAGGFQDDLLSPASHEAYLHGDDGAGNTLPADYGVLSDTAAAAPSFVPAVAPAQAAAAPPPSAVLEMSKDTTEMEALNAAMAESIKQYQLEEEMRRQRQLLAAGVSGAFTSKVAPPPSHAPFVPQAPVAAPVVAPVVAPQAAAPSALFGQTKQQPEVPAAGYGGNNSWVFGGVNQGAGALPPHLPAGYTQFDGYGGGGNVVGTMAAGHSGAELAAAEDDDDDLSTLLALCGVAG